MKRIIALWLSVIFVLSLCACGAQTVEQTEPATEATEAPTDAPAPTVTVPEGLVDEEEARALTNYYVTVLDESANPVVGATVLLIGGESISCITDETGVAVFSMPEGTYTASIEELPFGYEFPTEETEFAFESGDVSLVIQVRQTFSEPNDMGMEDSGLPQEEIPVEDVPVEDIPEEDIPEEDIFIPEE